MKYFIDLPMKMEPIVSSETSAIRTQTPGNYPKRNKLYKDISLIFFMGCTAHCVYRIFWSRGTRAFKIRALIWKMVAPLQAEIILHCFKQMAHSSVTFLLTHVYFKIFTEICL